MAHQTDLFPPPPPGVEDTGIVDVFSDQAGYRNLIFSINADWSDTGNDWTIASRVHEMSHIIEFNYDGIYGLPNWTDEAWGDSQFAGIFQWDMYQKVAGLLPAGFKDRQWDELLNSVGDDGIHWFRDFYYPLYNGDLGNTDPSHQGAALFNRYFELLVEYLPKVNSSYARGRLNRGEFLHFMSGAAQVDLENLAKDALHWNNEVALELEGARIEFPEVLALYRDPECTPESDAAFCSRLGATCGSKAGADNCGVTRTVASCGSCSAPETCGGGGTPNVCGGGSTDTPCAGLCAPATTFPQSFQSNDVAASASCHETTANLQGLACGASPGRIFTVNGTVIDCNGGVTLPEKRNGGYCAQWSAGNPGEWAWFSTW